ncbi:MAG: tetratricopeptide repeat protein [Synergistaceae bacterium]|jgi:tetratricopeptide (TPR) repeat protein|nr:tetratricopeptide repeat protein [Synergistaceae bacterium]
MAKKTMRLPFAAAFVAVLFAFSAEAAPSLFERARNLYDIKEYRLALTLFEKVLDQEPENGEALDFASWCYRYLGDWESARNGFERAGKLLPDDQSRWIKVGLGETWLGAGGYKEAVSAFTQAIELAPDDDELVVRSLKGLIIAWASMGDSTATDDLLKRLSDKDKAAADDIQASARSLLEKATKTAEAGKTQETTMSDAGERQEKVTEQARSEVQGKEDGGGYEVLGFRLGDPIRSVLDSLKQQDLAYRTFEEATRYGVRFHIVALPALLPEILHANADGQACFLEEFQGKLLAVNVFTLWKERRGNLALRDEIFSASSLILAERFGEIAYSEDSGLHGEALWVPGAQNFIALEVNATIGASEGGNVTKVVSYYDLPGFLVFRDHVKEVNKRR